MTEETSYEWRLRRAKERAEEKNAEREEVLARVEVRDPCLRCGVRPQYHDSLGCENYTKPD